MTSAIFYHSTKHLMRLSIPNTMMRRVIISLAIFFLVLAVVGGALLGIYNPPEYDGGMRSVGYINNLSGLFFLVTLCIMAFPTYFTIRGTLQLINNPESSTLMLVSPLSSISRFWATIGPVLFMSSAPYLIIFLPFVTLFIFLDPLISIITLLYFVVLSGWSVVLSFVTIMFMLNYLGKEKTLRLAYGIPAFLLVLPILFSFAAEEYRAIAPIIGHWQLIFFAISIAILPPLFTHTCRRFYALITSSTDTLMEFNPPKWGTYNPWKFLDRKAIAWGMIPMTLLTGVLAMHIVEIDIFHESVIALIIFMLINHPVNAIYEEEKHCPQRWLLAPYAGTLKNAIWIKMILPLLFTGSCLILWVGHTNITWALSAIGIILLGIVLLTWRIIYTSSTLQKIIFVVTSLGLLTSQILW